MNIIPDVNKSQKPHLGKRMPTNVQTRQQRSCTTPVQHQIDSLSYHRSVYPPSMTKEVPVTICEASDI